MPYNAKKRAYNRAARGGIDDISPLHACACAPFKAASRAFRQSVGNDTSCACLCASVSSGGKGGAGVMKDKKRSER